MYCPNCGTKNIDGASFCKECGTMLNNGQYNYAQPAADNSSAQYNYSQPAPVRGGGSQYNYTQPGQVSNAQYNYAQSAGFYNGNNSAGNASAKPAFFKGPNRIRNIVLIIAAVLVITGTILGVVLYNDYVDYNTIVKTYIESNLEADAEDIIELYPDDAVDYALDDTYCDEDEFCELLEESIRDSMIYIEYNVGDDWKYSYEIMDSENFSSKELRELEETYEDDYDIDLDISAAKTVEVKIKLRGDYDSERITVDVVVIKVDGSWYIDISENYFSIFF